MDMGTHTTHRIVKFKEYTGGYSYKIRQVILNSDTGDVLHIDDKDLSIFADNSPSELVEMYCNMGKFLEDKPIIDYTEYLYYIKDTDTQNVINSKIESPKDTSKNVSVKSFLNMMLTLFSKQEIQKEKEEIDEYDNEEGFGYYALYQLVEEEGTLEDIYEVLSEQLVREELYSKHKWFVLVLCAMLDKFHDFESLGAELRDSTPDEELTECKNYILKLLES